MTTITFLPDLADCDSDERAQERPTLSCSCDNCGKRAERLALRCLIPIALATALYVYGMLDGAPGGLLSSFERFACQALIPGMLAGIAAIAVCFLWKSRRPAQGAESVSKCRLAHQQCSAGEASSQLSRTRRCR